MEVARMAQQAAQLEEQLARKAEQQQQGLQAAEEVQQADQMRQVHLRNIILKYMETEDHHSMFPVIATLLNLQPDEVAALRERREAREQARKGTLRRFFG